MSSRYRARVALLTVVALLAALGLPGMGMAADVSVQAAVFAPDAYEPDDDFDDAYVYRPAVDGNTFHSYRTFDGVNGVADDEYDVIAVDVAVAGTPIWVEVMYVDGRLDTYVRIYDAAGTELVEYDDNDYWYATYSEGAYFIAPTAGRYYVEVDNRDMMCAYELFITVGNARRVFGVDRFETAAEVSRLQWDNTGNAYYGYGYGPGDIVVANGLNPADALAGGSLAAQLGGVLLLTHPDHLPAATYDEIVRVTESLYWEDHEVHVHVLGGTAAVSDDVFEDLQGIRHVTHVHRIAGANRYATAAAIGDVMADEIGVSTSAYLVNGTAWADALAVAPVAAWANAPVLMTMKDSVPAETAAWLSDNGVTDVYIIGGESVVGAPVAAALDPLYTVHRISGDNRYATAKEVALHGVNDHGMNGQLATLASGESFADALSAAPIGWWTGAPLLLTPKDTLHAQVAAYFDESGAIGTDADDGIGCYVLGGPGAVSDTVYAAFRDHWKELLP